MSFDFGLNNAAIASSISVIGDLLPTTLIALGELEEIWARWEKAISEEFIPLEPPESIGFLVTADTSGRQGARAAEYSAAQLGQINRKLDKLIEAIDRLAGSS